MVIEDRVALLETAMSDLSNKVTSVIASTESVQADIAAIRSAVVGATKVGQFVKKHGPRALAFVLGIAASSGWVSAGTVEIIRRIVGA